MVVGRKAALGSESVAFYAPAWCETTLAEATVEARRDHVSDNSPRDDCCLRYGTRVACDWQDRYILAAPVNQFAPPATGTGQIVVRSTAPRHCMHAKY